MNKAKTHSIFFFLLLFGNLFVFCTKKNNTEAKVAEIYSFEYTIKDKAIMLDGTINDSIPLKLFFDTGTSFNYRRTILLSDSLRQIVQDTLCTLKVGDIEHLYRIGDYRIFDFVFQHFSKATSVLDIDFFKNEIIKISFQDKYIQRLTNTDGLKEYICVQLISDERYNGGLGVDIEVFVQGKHIKEKVLLDTGSNGFVLFNNNIIEKYAINVDSAQRIQSLNGRYRKYRLKTDSIKAGYVFSGKQTVEFLADTSSSPYSGNLGNAFLENFEIILDFKESKMYLKANSLSK